MLVDVVTELAAEVLRPAAAEADTACAAPAEVLAASVEVGLPHPRRSRSRSAASPRSGP